jgi:hypothetical protein
MKVVGFVCGPWRWYRGVGEIHMNKGRVGEERGGKETDGCPLSLPGLKATASILNREMVCMTFTLSISQTAGSIVVSTCRQVY